MRTVSVARVVTLDERQRKQLEAFSNSRSLPDALVIRAKIVLQAATGAQNLQIDATQEANEIFCAMSRLALPDDLPPGGVPNNAIAARQRSLSSSRAGSGKTPQKVALRARILLLGALSGSFHPLGARWRTSTKKA